jgi:alanine racemase
MIPNEVIIDLGALRHNFSEIRRLAGPQARILAVVKSDAYGHGMIPVAKTLEAAGVDYLGVFEVTEGLELRKSGCKTPILVMMGVLRDEVDAAVEYGLMPALFHPDIADRLAAVSAAQEKVTPVHIKVDTGMTRLGVPYKDLSQFLKQLLPLKGIEVTGIFSHLAVADQPDQAFTDEQISRFLNAVETCRRIMGFEGDVHVANSGALLGGKGLELGLIRPGILLYGSPPAEGWPGAASFKPVMCFKSQVIQVRTVPPGTPVSYGRTYTTQGSRTIATVPVGYDDGYNRLLSNNGEMLIHGQRVPIVGRVCMNLTMVDVTGIGDVAVGDEVVLLGTQGTERITAEQIAMWTRTISYEVYCSLGKSNRRMYVNA